MQDQRKKDEGRLSVEFLRLLSYFVNYQSSSTILFLALFMGLMLVILSTIFLAINIINVLVFWVIYFFGGILFSIAAMFLLRTRRQFRRYLDEVAKNTLIDNSEVNDIVKYMQMKLEKETKLVREEVANEINSMEKQLERLYAERRQLKKELEKMRSERGGVKK
jgi:uncharacterized membrane protein (DUF485 family)